jgi:hypothetical protein
VSALLVFVWETPLDLKKSAAFLFSVKALNIFRNGMVFVACFS